MEEIANQLALLSVKGIGPIQCRKLIKDFETPNQLFSAKKIDFYTKYKDRGNKIHERILQAKKAINSSKELIAFCHLNAISITTYSSKSYPTELKKCVDAPQILFSSGSKTWNNSPALSIVGTRKCTNYGIEAVNNICKNLSKHNITIVSGLANGIDYYAHHFALENKLTTNAVLGHGLNHIYPKYHLGIAEKIKKNGCLISEFNPSEKPTKYTFPKRNRIIAGISTATLIVETPYKGGAMITARMANDYNKDVFSIPGNIKSKQSQGCHQLIKNNQAHLISSAEDIINLMGLEPKPIERKKIRAKNELNDLHRKIIKQVENFPNMTTDELSMVLEISIQDLQIQLTKMELNGDIKLLFGKKIKILI